MNQQSSKERMNSFLTKKIFLGMSFGKYIKSLFTPFNIAAGIMLLIALPIVFLRYTKGIGSISGVSNDTPWGSLIGFNVLSGGTLSAGGYTITSAVYLFGMKKYYPLVRAAILSGFLGYFFVVIALLFDIGRPWRLPYPIIYSFGVTSIMFLVAWQVALYFSTQFVEFSPAIFEWLNIKKLRDWIEKLMIGATIFGLILSTLHQSALGGLFLLAPNKLHPLWYSSFITVFFFISSIAAGISMVIFISGLAIKFFKNRIGNQFKQNITELTAGLAKAASIVLFTYFGLKIIGIAHGNNWNLLNTTYGYWFLVEIIIFVLLPCFLFALGARNKSIGLIRFTSFWTIIGIIINRLNVSIIAFNWKLNERSFPDWKDIVISLTIILVAVLTFRWIVNRMPVLDEHPDYKHIQ
jgi:Ni/Fe-hydrogenase subunit HybB-like protein